MQKLKLLPFILAGLTYSCSEVSGVFDSNVLQNALNPMQDCNITVSDTKDVPSNRTPSADNCIGLINTICPTLREAILKANSMNSMTGPVIICLGQNKIYTLESYDLFITGDITIKGNGSTIQRDPNLKCNHDDINNTGEFRIFQVTKLAKLTLKNVVVKNGCADGLYGGGIFNDGTLIIQDSTISGNSAEYGGGIYNGDIGKVIIQNSIISDNNSSRSGGGISNKGKITIQNSSILRNSTDDGFGGGIDNERDLTIQDSTISGNIAKSGGGIYNSNLGTVSIQNSTISSNIAKYGSGGGVDNYGTLTINNSTVSGNSAKYGGGIHNYKYSKIKAIFITIANNKASENSGGIHNEGTFNIKNSIIASNKVGNGFKNCTITGETFIPSGVNFTDDNTCVGFNKVTSIQLKLQPLGNYGGSTQTHALGSDSVAIDAVNDCTDLNNQPVITDQRGIKRPQGTKCDAGAYEYDGAFKR